MTYESRKSEYSKEHIYVIEIDAEYCTLDFGAGDCVAGERSIVTTAVATDDFNVGDEIEGATSGAVGTIISITGTDPTYTINYRLTNGIDFQTAAETITNNTATGSATKDGNASTLITADDGKCYNTLDNCQSTANFTGSLPTADTGITRIDRESTYYSRPAGSFIDDGFEVGDVIYFTSEFVNTLALTVTSLTDSLLYVSDTQFPVAGTGVERIYNGAIKTYRFCQPRSPAVFGINAIPSLKSIDITPAKIDVAGGLGERSNVSLVFNDHPHDDIGIDNTVDERTYIATDRGTFWTKFRARNPNYQFRKLRVLTGYIQDRKFIATNFKTRNYVIDKLNVDGGQCKIVAKDPLKRAGSKKALVPIANTGVISDSGGITDSATAINLTPSGVGDLEYAASGFITLSGSEICEFTRSSDVLTIVRAQYNTTAIAHDEDSVVQQCYQQTAEVDAIVKDLLVNFAGISPGFINDSAWAYQVDTYLNGNLSGLIASPTDVEGVLKELSEAKPHFVYWDELNQNIQLIALQPPPDEANLIDMDSGIIKGSFKSKDLPDMRANTIYYVFGQVDPTKDLKEKNNYTQTIVRVDNSSISKYQSNQIKTVISRWIPSTSKPIAENAAQLLGRRFSDIPREIEFSLDEKDGELSIGETRTINHRDIVDASGSPLNTVFQIISAKEDSVFKYKAIEYTYGQVLAGDNDVDVDTIKVSFNEIDLDLYTRYVDYFGDVPTGSTTAVFEIETNVIVGSSDYSIPALSTGTWPVGATITLVNRGYIVGRGGMSQTSVAARKAGSDAMDLGHDIILNNLGIIGGGGGAGGISVLGPPGALKPTAYVGGGGAGDIIGYASESSPFGTTASYNGSLLFGGVGSEGTSGNVGGDLGQDGGDSTLTPASVGGIAGNAINLNGNTITYTTTGDIRGTVA